MRKKGMEKLPETPQPLPAITPEMLQTTFKVLESHGMVYQRGGTVYIPTEKGWKVLMTIGPKEIVTAYGHPDILATSKNCIKITKRDQIGKDDAIIGIKADKACRDLSEEFKKALKSGKKLKITIEAEGVSESILSFCSPALILEGAECFEVRKDDEINESTVGILSEKSASDLSEELKKKLRAEVEIKIVLEIV